MDKRRKYRCKCQKLYYETDYCYGGQCGIHDAERLQRIDRTEPFALDLMKSYAAGKMTVLLKLRAPNSLPYIFTSLKVSVPACVIAALVSEYFAEKITGVGRRIRECILQAQYSTAWAYIVTACVIGIVLFAALMASEKLNYEKTKQLTRDYKFRKEVKSYENNEINKKMVSNAFSRSYAYFSCKLRIKRN